MPQMPSMSQRQAEGETICQAVWIVERWDDEAKCAHTKAVLTMLLSLSAFLLHAFGQAKNVNRASTLSMPVPKGLVLPRKVYFVNACIPELR